MAQKAQNLTNSVCKMWHETDLLAFKGTGSWNSFSTPKPSALGKKSISKMYTKEKGGQQRSTSSPEVIPLRKL